MSMLGTTGTSEVRGSDKGLGVSSSGISDSSSGASSSIAPEVTSSSNDGSSNTK